VNVFQLPVSRSAVVMRLPSGGEELLILEGAATQTALAIAILGRLSHAPDGSVIDWQALSATDLDAALLRLRQIVFGDAIRAGVTCPAAQCGKRIDIGFGIGDYLEHHSPRPPRGAEPAEESGWMRLRGAAVSFRLPTAADQAAAESSDDPRREMIRRCIRPQDASAASVRRVENAMEAMAPSLAHNLDAQCPECGAAVEVYFDPRRFCLIELREHAAFIYEDTHLLAEHYHWPEAEILSLPRDRRIRYVEIVRAARSAA
jgi:hypothetical protein